MAGIQTPFSTYRLLSFDIYGTLIDWESGIVQALSPIQDRLPDSSPLKSGGNDLALGTVFTKHEARLQSEEPGATYDKILRDAYIAVAKELLENVPGEDQLEEEGVAFADSIAVWPAFPDTIQAMRKLKRLGFKLVPVSNVDHGSFGKTLAGPLSDLREPLSPGSDPLDPFFDAVYTAQDIGSYKPDLRNFEYLINHVKADFGVEKHEILHVAQSLRHDHVPSKQIELDSVWIARGKGGVSGMGGDVEELLGKVSFAWKFESLGDFADAVEAELQK
ncbi:uncharacterized protein BHQ10_001559 [Talaromyces amestolkiae]|uniref:Haloacid dehalogenase, type II n=1 Tax=Talaromyces amestolkiae TaxID=1196081 RepID=A0A364KPR1_TALAM|nr:uncharacterized protein BHQ10_001559 [Talaromyces amestolkiae]RAO65547.1 hypothetical protein BHQ10_001559 [Talaromyces amestolkiae]